MAFSYLYCSGCTGSELSIDVTGSTGSSYISLNQRVPRWHYRESTDFLLTLTSPVTCDINPIIQVTTHYYHFGFSAATTISLTSGVILAGNITGVTTLPTYNKEQVAGWNLFPRFDEQYYAYEILAQQNTPLCSQSALCALRITDVAVTAPSILGASDGSLTATIAGNTGGTQSYILDGGTPQASPTFAGLAGGSYQLRVEEASCFWQVEVIIPQGVLATGYFVVSEPATIVASENPIILSVSTPVFDGSSNFSRTSFTIDGAIGDGYKMVFTLSSPINYSTTFYGKFYPNANNYFLGDLLYDDNFNYVRTNSQEEIADSLAQAFENDIIISSNYFINTVGNEVILVAKTASIRFDISTSNVSRFDSSGNFTVSGVSLTVLQSGTDFNEGDILDNYNIFADIYGSRNDIQYGAALTPDQFNRQTELQLPYQKSNYMLFDLSEICKAFVSTPKPDYTFTGFTTVNSYMQPFYSRFGEIYPLVANTNTNKKKVKDETGYFWVTNAALNFEDENDMTAYVGQQITGATKYVPFLTNSPNPKPTSRVGVELLYFIIPKDMNTGAITVEGTITFWNSLRLLPIPFITISTGGTYNYGGCIAINVSYSTLGLAAYEAIHGNLINTLQLHVITASGGTLSLSKIYKYDLDNKINNIGISWLNKLGTFDTFDFYGTTINDYVRSQKEYTVTRQPNIGGSLPFGYKYNSPYDVSLTKEITVNSGWIDSVTFNWLSEELLASNEIYIYSNDFDNFVLVTGFKANKDSNDNLFSIELKLQYTSEENNISV